MKNSTEGMKREDDEHMKMLAVGRAAAQLSRSLRETYGA